MANTNRTPLDNPQVEENFREIEPLFKPAEALFEANRCLYCYDAPCTAACPTHIDVPSFIKKIASGNIRGAARIIFDANPIGATCARVCPVEVLCEGACVEKTLLNRPIPIGRLQRYATEPFLACTDTLFSNAPRNGRSIGIVGSGPAGLSCAMYLARLGYDVTVYDKRPMPGGLDTYGMAEYKMSQPVSLAEVEKIAGLGVKFAVNTLVGNQSVAAPGARNDDDSLQNVEAGNDGAKERTISITELLARHDAIFIAVGLGGTRRLEIPGEELDGVIDALGFIEQVKTRDWKSIPFGRQVVVIGGGNTAIDAATQVKRLGAERVIIAYRKSEAEMPAYHYEQELARRDGIEFIWYAEPVAILADEGSNHVAGIRLKITDGTSGEIEINCDMVIKAIGQSKQSGFLSQIAGVEIDEKGRVLVNDQMQTSHPKIFAGGDCVNGGGEAVEAAQMGKIAASGIHKALTGEVVRFAGM